MRDAEVTSYHEFKRLIRKYSMDIQGNRSRMYSVMNNEELDAAISKMPGYIEDLIEKNDLTNREWYLSGLVQ